MPRTRLLILLALVAIVILAVWLDIETLLSLDNIRRLQTDISAGVVANPLTAAGLYFMAYTLMAACNIPGAAAMTLIGGALFGLATGTLLVSFASTCGATLAFLLSRYLLREMVEQRFDATVARINEGIARDGAYYLFTLRLIPVFPFWLINLTMGLTRLPVTTYYWVSQIGMLPATLVYVNAGTQIGQLESAQDILSPALIGSFALLGLFPLVSKKALDWLQARRRRRTVPKFARPKHFDTNLVVIGGGSAGLVTAYIAAAAGAKVILIEKDRMGGDCLNTGCVPSKALLRSAEIKAYIDRAEDFGLRVQAAEADFAAVMQRVRRVIAAIEPHDSVERYTALGVDCISGEAHVATPWSVTVGDRTITTRSIVIATGGSPAIPPVEGIEHTRYLTSDTLWQLQERPDRLLILGGGAVGCELAQAFARLGSTVTVLEQSPRLLATEDAEVSAALATSFHKEGIEVRTGSRALRFTSSGAEFTLEYELDGATHELAFDTLIVATGRRGNGAGIGLEALGVEVRADGTVPVNRYLQTVHPDLLACGDVSGEMQLTNAAAHQAWYCAMNALYGRFWRFAVDYSVIPRAVFCSPELARVGLNEQQAEQQGITFEVTTYDISDLDRAIADEAAQGFVRVLTPPNSDRILGVTIVGRHAADTISEFVLAMRHGLGLGKVLGTVHIYPTLTEANKFAAGNWRKAHLSPALLRLSRWLNHRRTG